MHTPPLTKLTDVNTQMNNHLKKWAHTRTISSDWLPRIRQLLDSSTGTNFTPKHLCLSGGGEGVQTPSQCTPFTWAPHTSLINGWISVKNNSAVEPDTSSCSASSLTFIMCSIVCTCVIETHLWKQLSLHHFPILFQQSVSNLLRLTALHLSSPPPTSPYLCSSFSLNLTLSSLHVLILSYLSCRQFPLSTASLMFSFVSIVCLTHLFPPCYCSSCFYLERPLFLSFF